MRSNRQAPRFPRSAPAMVAVATCALALASCSSGSSSGSTTSTTAFRRPTCTQGVTLPKLQANPVPGSTTDWDLTSFDDTTIRFHWLPVKTATATSPAPTILMGPGWSETGDTSTTGSALFDSLSIPAMWKHGYNVLTWDPRGFGGSGGRAAVNDPKKEGRDVQALIDWLSSQPVARQDRAGDPRVGMAGFSYGGGIQLTTAAIDCRVDAIVPGLSWRSLETALYPEETVKQGWADLLVRSAQLAGGKLDPHIAAAHDEGAKTGVISKANQDWFRSRGPGDLAKRINVPTLIIQGTVDNLFTLHQGLDTYRTLHAKGVPVDMIWFCGGHGACLTKGGDDPFVTERSFAWFDRYLKGDRAATTGPGFETLDQNGDHWSAPAYPTSVATPITTTGTGTLTLTPGGGSGGVQTKAGDVLGGVVATITPSKAERALEVPISIDRDALVLGAPKLTVTYAGAQATKVPTTSVGPRAFAQIVDDSTGLVVGNQLTPVPLTLDGKQHRLALPLEMIVAHVRAGDALTLQLVADTTTYHPGPLDGSKVSFSKVTISLPVAKGMSRS